MTLKTAFQGEKGAYSELAARKFFVENFELEPELIPCESFYNVFSKLISGKSDYAVVPIENTLAGSIHENYDLMKENKSKIIGEQVLRVEHNLIACKNGKLENIKEIYSHPQALAQCSNYLNTLKEVKKFPSYDTAGSAKMIASSSDNLKAAIASREAAELYSLKVIKTSIENNHENYTRFIVISLNNVSDCLKDSFETSRDPNIKYKTSIVFSLKSIPGALFKSLSVFSLRDINLFKIESRPLVSTPWEYLFYLDFDGHTEDDVIKRALSNLSEVANDIYVFGSYPVKNYE